MQETEESIFSFDLFDLPFSSLPLLLYPIFSLLPFHPTPSHIPSPPPHIPLFISLPLLSYPFSSLLPFHPFRPTPSHLSPPFRRNPSTLSFPLSHSQESRNRKKLSEGKGLGVRREETFSPFRDYDFDRWDSKKIQDPQVCGLFREREKNYRASSTRVDFLG